MSTEWFNETVPRMSKLLTRIRELFDTNTRKSTILKLAKTISKEQRKKTRQLLKKKRKKTRQLRK